MRNGFVGNGAKRTGDRDWRRLVECRVRSAKSVFRFGVNGEVATSTHAGIPWLRFIRKRLGKGVHFCLSTAGSFRLGIPPLPRSIRPCGAAASPARTVQATSMMLTASPLGYASARLPTARPSSGFRQRWFIGNSTTSRRFSSPHDGMTMRSMPGGVVIRRSIPQIAIEELLDRRDLKTDAPGRTSVGGGSDTANQLSPVAATGGHPLTAGTASHFASTHSIRSIYADYGTQWQEVAIPPQHRRIKAGRATAVQKQSILASKLVPEKTRELAKRNF